jgi:hypothetical protein
MEPQQRLRPAQENGRLPRVQPAGECGVADQSQCDGGKLNLSSHRARLAVTRLLLGGTV